MRFKAVRKSMLSMVFLCQPAFADQANDLFRAALGLYNSQDYSGACDLLSKGLAVSHDAQISGKAYYYYGGCLLKLNRTRQALAAFKRSSELGPATDEGRDALVQQRKVEASMLASSAGKADSRAVKSFNWVYNFQPSPGLRSWAQDGAGHWHERYPDGHEAKVFNQSHQGVARNCAGAIVSSSNEPDFEVFIPNLDCSQKTVLFRRGGGNWANMGDMLDVH